MEKADTYFQDYNYNIVMSETKNIILKIEK